MERVLEMIFKGDPGGLKGSDSEIGKGIKHIPPPLCDIHPMPRIHPSSFHLHQAAPVCLFISLPRSLCCAISQDFLQLPIVIHQLALGSLWSILICPFAEFIPLPFPKFLL